jgi:acetyl esterase/lipase
MQAQTDGDDGCDTPFDHDGADSPESRWLGAPLQSVPEVAAQADATTYIPTADALPPFWIAHGDADCEVPYLQSQGLADALTAAGGRPLLTFVDDGRHGDPRFDSGLMAPTIAWLQQVLEPGG